VELKMLKDIKVKLKILKELGQIIYV